MILAPSNREIVYSSSLQKSLPPCSPIDVCGQGLRLEAPRGAALEGHPRRSMFSFEVWCRGLVVVLGPALFGGAVLLLHPYVLLMFLG